MKTKKFTGDRIFDFVNVTVILLITIIILVPLLNVLASSFSGSTALAEGGFIFFPKEWSLDNYRAVFKDTSIWKAFFISVAKTVIGVEIVEEAVEAAKVNAALNGLTNCRFIAGDVLKVLDNLTEKPDMIILDLGLPDGDGIEIIKNVREISKIPIIVVSARQEEEEKIQALDLGADDYVTKPFYMGELLARIRVALRKSNQIPEEKKEKIFQCDYLKVDWEKHQVSIDGKEVHLTPMEYKILKLLIDNRGKVLTHNYILSQIWGSAQGVEAANLRVFMAALRRKIEKDPGNCRFILTEIGVGYRFREATE